MTNPTDRNSKRAQWAGQLYDLLVQYPEGLTGPDVQDILDWDANQFGAAVQALRDIFSDDGDSITVVCEPQGQREPWLYILVDGAATTNEDDSRWVGIMLNHIERRLKTMRNVLATGIKATRATSIIGRKVRIYHLHITRAQDEVRLLHNTDGLPE